MKHYVRHFSFLLPIQDILLKIEESCVIRDKKIKIPLQIKLNNLNIITGI
jgi:hypothetical protein